MVEQRTVETWLVPEMKAAFAQSSLCKSSVLTHKAHEFDDIVKETNIMGLDTLRDRLDIIDERILSLLSERAKIIIQVADFKQHHDIPIYVPEREVSIIERLRTANPGPLPGDTIERIYRNILEEMRKFESEHSPH
jgi:chorismate mutase-like protein